MSTRKLLRTASELPHLPGKGAYRYELIEGVRRVYEPKPGQAHERICANMHWMLALFAPPRSLGTVGYNLGFKLESNPDTVCLPDVSLTRSGRIQWDSDEPYIAGAPDLAVEVLAPANEEQDTAQRVTRYLRTGARLVWIVDPQHRSIGSYRSDREPVVAKESELLCGEDVLPGFQCRVADVCNPNPPACIGRTTVVRWPDSRIPCYDWLRLATPHIGTRRSQSGMTETVSTGGPSEPHLTPPAG